MLVTYKNGNILTKYPNDNISVSPVNEASVSKDIAESKGMERLLKKAADLANIGVWQYNNTDNTIYWSDVTKIIHGVPADYNPTLERLRQHYNHSEEGYNIGGVIERAVNTSSSFDIETRILTFNGDFKWVRVLGEPEMANGQCISIRGSFQDIDVRKKSEIAVEKLLCEKSVILESIGDGFFTVDHDWIITYWNKKAEEMTGFSKSQTLNQMLWNVFPPSNNSVAYKTYHSAIKTNKICHFENYYASLDTWFDVGAYPSESGLSVYFKDITAKKHSEMLLIESEKRYMQLFQLSPLPTWLYHAESLAFLEVNQSAIDHYGYTKDEFLSMTINDLKAKSKAKKTPKIPDNEKTTKRQNRKIVSHTKKSGEIINVEIQSNTITYKRKNARIIVANDITESLQHIKTVEMQNDKLREISWIQSHVVRAPLTRIMSLAKLITTSGNEEQDLTQMLEYLLLSANELDAVIIDIMNKSKAVHK